MAKAVFETPAEPKPLEEAAKVASGSIDQGEKRKPGRPPGSGKKKAAPKVQAAPVMTPEQKQQSIDGFSMLAGLLLKPLARIMDAKLGKGIGWTDAEIEEAKPVAGRVLHKYLGEIPESDELQLAGLLVLPPLLRYLAKVSPETSAQITQVAAPVHIEPAQPIEDETQKAGNSRPRRDGGGKK